MPSSPRRLPTVRFSVTLPLPYNYNNTSKCVCRFSNSSGRGINKQAETGRTPLFATAVRGTSWPSKPHRIYEGGAAVVRSGMRRHVPARRPFGNLYIQLGAKVRGLPLRSVFLSSCEYSCCRYNIIPGIGIPRLCPFLPFFGPNNLLSVIET